jgi:2-keto-3-deoxy-L-rhamnonate aldolase RhmA
VVRWAKAAGYDAIWVDLEHCGISLDATSQICSTALDLGMTPWVRVPEDDYGVIGRVLDGGALGIIAPRVETPEQAQRYLTACRFAPLGQRSQIAQLVQVGFQRMSISEMNELINDAVTVKVLIESRRGVDNVEAIAALPGIDIVAVGANDLSADLGHTGEPGHPDVIEACRHVIKAAMAHGKVAIIGGLADPEKLRSLYELGAAPYLFAGIDTDLFLTALHSRVQQSLNAYKSHSV